MSEPPHEDAGPGADETVGTVGEEAVKLFGALSEWARDHGSDLGQGLSGLAAHAAATAKDVEEHVATDSAECRYCPICRTVHAVRQTSPEVRAHLVSAASSLMQAAAGMLATAVPPESRAADGGVQRIDLDADSDGDTNGDTNGAWPGEDEQ